MISKEQLKIYANLPNYGDVETRGLWGVVNSLEDFHVLGSIVDDPDTGEEVTLLFHDREDLCGATFLDPYDNKNYTIPKRVGTLLEGFRYFYMIGQSDNGYLSVHNCATFDKPVIEKVMPKCIIPDHKWVDTFIQSKIQWFDRQTPKGAKSQHGLAAFALRGGMHKPEITDYTKMDALMLHRIVEDFKAQKFAHNYLKKERELLESKIGITFDDSYKMEWDYAKTCQKQEVYGALVDRVHMEKCVEDWDKRLQELEGLIEPMLPPTVKPQGTKITRKEMAIVLGYPEHVTSQMKEPTEIVNRGGEQITVPIKPYYKPTTKYTVEKKTNSYSGMHVSYGFSPSFLKKKELTDWIKSNHPDTKPKDWDIEKTETIATLLNSNACKHFDVEPEDVDLIGGSFTRVKFEDSKLTQHEIVKGMLIKGGISFANEWNLKKDSDGQIMRAEKDTTISYPLKAAPENQMHITVKKGDALFTSPKFSEKEYEQLETEDGKMVGEYNTTMHRRRFLLNPKDPEEKGLIANIREDGRIPCGVMNFSTATGRSAHKVWVNAPGAGALYGEEVRRCIIAPKGKKLVSSDMNSAQLSIAAYYANNYDYFKAVCYGQEFKVDDKGNEIIHPDTGKPWFIGESGHCVNSRAFELISEEEWKTAVEKQDQDLIHSMGLRRKKSKAGTFGTIFGCSGKKLATMLDIDETRGNEKKNAFLSNLGLDRVIQILDMMCEKNKRGGSGIIELPFGYFATCKSPHARFNYLDQGTEAACQKWAELYFDRESKKLNLQSKRILSYHK